MAEDIARQIVLARRPRGPAQLNNFRLEELPLPIPGPGEILLKVLYLSLDPYMRGRMDDKESYAASINVGDPMPGESVNVVLASNNPEYYPGDMVCAFTGWTTHSVSNGTRLRRLVSAQTPVSTALGVLGMPGFTAYAGLNLIGKPARGETVAVAAASGPVGSLVGQLSKIAGAKAVGIAGGAKKCAFVREELGFDVAVDHSAADFRSLLAVACPSGIDVYFENVGGAIWQAVLPLFNQFARVPLCGLIDQYDGNKPRDAVDHLPETMRQMLTKSVSLRGFINFEFAETYFENFLRDVSQWMAEGRIRYREDIVDGLENAPTAFLGMLRGQNFGKLLVRVADPSD